jgi:hypothetical protein
LTDTHGFFKFSASVAASAVEAEEEGAAGAAPARLPSVAAVLKRETLETQSGADEKDGVAEFALHPLTPPQRAEPLLDAAVGGTGLHVEVTSLLLCIGDMLRSSSPDAVVASLYPMAAPFLLISYCHSC